MGDDFEKEFREAEERLRRQEIPVEWGSARQTQEGDRILARFLGRELQPPFDDVVFRFVSYPGEPQPFYLKRTVQLERVLDNAKVGDIVGLKRGQDKDIGRPNPMQTWDGFVKPCAEPLGRASGPAPDSDIPFGF
jgi:hypothetical protein